MGAADDQRAVRARQCGSCDGRQQRSDGGWIAMEGSQSSSNSSSVRMAAQCSAVDRNRSTAAMSGSGFPQAQRKRRQQQRAEHTEHRATHVSTVAARVQRACPVSPFPPSSPSLPPPFAGTDHLLQLEVHAVLCVDHHASVDLSIRQLHRHLVTLTLVKQLHGNTNLSGHDDGRVVGTVGCEAMQQWQNERGESAAVSRRINSINKPHDQDSKLPTAQIYLIVRMNPRCTWIMP